MYHGYVEMLRAKAYAAKKKRGRKGRKKKARKGRYSYLAGMYKTKRRGRKARGSRSTIMSRKTRRAINRARHRQLMKKTRGWTKSARRRYSNAGDYIAMKAYRKANYGPIPFAHQPRWVREFGRKGKAKRSRRRRRR